MATILGSLLVSLGLDSAQFKSGLSQSERELKRTEARIRKSGKGMADLGRNMALSITLPMVALGVAAVKGAKDQAAAVAQVEAALRSMGAASGKTAAELAKTADALEMRSLFDADVILTKVTANLLTFGNVAGEQFDRAQQAAIDMATRLGSDPQSAAIMLGKALNSPIQGITALTRVGVQFTAAQKAQIKGFVETGRVAQAQKIILAELERQFGGAAQAAADTSPWRKAQVGINQAMDKIGEAILPVLPVIADSIKAVAEAFNELSPAVQKGVLVIGGLAAVLGPVLTVVGSLRAALAPLIVGMSGTAASAATAAAATTGLRATLLKLIASLGPYGLAIAGVSALIFILTSRTKELTAAQKAKANETARAAEADRVASDAAQKLANASAEQRKQMLANIQVVRAQAAEALRGAKANIELAKSMLLRARADAQAEVLRSTRNTTGAGSGYDPTLAALGRKGRIVDPAQAKLDRAERLYAEGLGQIDGLDRILRDASKPVSLSPVVGTPATGGGTGSKSSRAADTESRFQNELAGYEQQTLSARQSLATPAEALADLELRALELARIRTLAEIKADKELSDTQKARLADAVENLAEFERAGIERDERLRLFSESTDLADAEFRAQADALRLQLDLAETDADRKRIALQILKAEDDYLRGKLAAVALNADLNKAIRDQAAAELKTLNATAAARRENVARANETQLEAFLRQGNRSPEKLAEDMTGIGIDGLNGLSDGLANVIAEIRSVNEAFKGMRDVFLNVIQDMIAALVRLGIQKAITAAIGLFTGGGFTGDGAPGTAGGMDLRGFALPAIAGARAMGGPVSAGKVYLVGEHGPELMVAGARGNVIPNHELGSIGASRPTGPIHFHFPGVRTATEGREAGAQAARRFKQGLNGPVRT